MQHNGFDNISLKRHVNHPGLIISCEHGGRDVPPAYAPFFAEHEALLASHRGWDPGALQLGRQMAEAFDAPLFAATTTRLLVDLNRSVGHRQLYSEITRNLPVSARRDITLQHYRPHRDRIEGEIERRIAHAEPVIHIASHSFTPVLHGVTRRADVAWLYDPRRSREVVLARRWMAELARRSPHWQLRRNYPYQGRGDGLASMLRKRYAAHDYLGIELEVNQRHIEQDGAAWAELRNDLIVSLRAALAPDRS